VSKGWEQKDFLLQGGHQGRSSLFASIWDLLFYLFVALPLITGGLWWRSEGIRLEYTHIGPALVILSAVALLAHRRGRFRWQDSSALRTLFTIWECWRRGVNKQPALYLGLGSLAVGAAWFFASISRHQGFSSHAADLGIFANGIFNLSQSGTPLSSLKGGISLLADHQIFLIYPISWIFSLFPSISTLLAIQSFGLASGAMALAFLVRQRLGKESSFVALAPLVYWAFPATRAANLFDFHPEVLMLPLFLFGALGLQSQIWRGRLLGSLALISAMAAKESGGPVAVGLGLAWLAGGGPTNSQKFTRPLGALLLCLGTAWFYLCTKVLPSHLGVSYAYGGLYSPFGSSLSDLLLAPFRHPAEFLERMLGWPRLKFLLHLLLTLCFLPLLAPRMALAALPGLFMLFLAKGDQRLSTGFHYGIEPSVGLFLALSAALSHSWVQKNKERISWALVLLAALCYGRSEAFHWRFYSISPDHLELREQWLPSLQAEKSWATNGVLVPHLSLRPWVEQLPSLQGPEGRLVDCVLWDRELNQSPMGSEAAKALESRLNDEYSIEAQCQSWTVYMRRTTSGCLLRIPPCPLP
jgi:uncharacterized membrane protein